MTARIGLVALAVAALAAAGCGSSKKKASTSTTGTGGAATTPAAPASSGQALSVKETEYKLTPSALRVSKAGTVKITVANNGTVTHSLEVEGPGGEAKAGNISPGSSTTLTVKLAKAGSFKMYCPIDGHRKLGMQGTVTVGGSGGSAGAAGNAKPAKGGGSSGGTSTGGGGSGGGGGGGYGY